MKKAVFSAKVAIAMCLVLLAAGCSFASLNAKPGEYSVSGYTTTPEMAMQTASDNYVQERNTEEYWRAVRQGKALAYPGGGYNNDYWFYYGSQGYMPAVPETTVAPSGTPVPVTPEDLRRVEGKANDALRMHKKLRDRLQQSDGGTAQE
jgi:hypothetical protein